MKEIEIKLRELRKTKKLSQEELASNLGISRQSVISLEHGEYLPSLPLIIDLLKFFEMPFEQIIQCEGISLEKGGEIEMAKEISPWSPFREVGSLHDAIDRMFEDSIVPRISPTLAVPAVNLRENEESVIVEVEIPGVKEEDLDIEVNNEMVTIRGQKKSEEEIKEKDYYRREFSYGSFSRSIAMPVEIESDNAEAELKDGTLRITLPKVKAIKPKSKKIQLKKK